MANTNLPFGLLPLGVNAAASGTPSFSLISKKLASNNTVVAAKGDGMQLLATGYVSTVAAAGVAVSQWAGIFWGCEYLSVSQGKRVVSPYWPGGDNSGEVDVLLIPLTGSGAPQQFYGQAFSTNFVFEDIGENVDIAYAAPTVIGATARSNTTLAQSTLATTAALPWRIQNLWSAVSPNDRNGVDNASSYNWIVVSFNGEQATGI